MWFEQEKAAMNLFLASGEIRGGYLAWVHAPFFVALCYALPDSMYADGTINHARLP